MNATEPKETIKNKKNDRWKKAAFIGLLIILSFTAIAPVALYFIQFAANGLSGDTQDWAHFGSYLAGTLGVMLIGATLWALIITLRQQQALLEIQREMLKTQKKEMQETRDELARTAKSNEKAAMIRSVETVFPVLNRSLNGVNDSVFFKNRDVSLKSFVKQAGTLRFIHEYSIGDAEEGVLYKAYVVAKRLVKYCCDVSDTEGDLAHYMSLDMESNWLVAACVLSLFRSKMQEEEYWRLMKFFRHCEVFKYRKKIAIFMAAGKAMPNGWQESGLYYLDADGTRIDQDGEESLLLMKLKRIDDFELNKG